MAIKTIRKPQKTRLEHILVLGFILLFAALLNFYRLDSEGFGNLYYAAGVKSMLSNWHNFFFVSFDPAGFVTIDKPPLGLWIQVISSMFLGFDGWSLLMPQALAGVLSVALLYYLVARLFGPSAGLVSALVLTLTPISVAANRNNTMDSLLVMTSILAALTASLAAEKGRLRWLLVCVFLVGVGFNIKMLQAFLVLPAFFLLYIFTAPIALWKRIFHLLLSSLLLAIVSLSWAIIVDLTPTEKRPYIGSSDNNTVMELIIGHNGAARLGGIMRVLQKQPDPPSYSFPAIQPNPPSQPGRPSPLPARTNPRQIMRNDEIGSPGILRLFNKQLAGQISWFLPLSLLCFFTAIQSKKITSPLHSQHQALLLWAIWLVPQVIFFSFAGMFHRYYLEMMAPAIAALTGIGIVILWQSFAYLLRIQTSELENKPPFWITVKGWILPSAILSCAAIETIILLHFPDWAVWLIPLLIGLSVISALGLIVIVLMVQLRSSNYKTKNNLEYKINKFANFAKLFAFVGMIALLIAPTVWSITPLLYGGDKGLPFAGPDLKTARSANELPNLGRLIGFLQANRNQEKYFLGTINARTASPFILLTGEPVMAMGGFTGNDPILTKQDLEMMVENHAIRFFLLPGNAPPADGRNNLKRPPPPNIYSAPQSWVYANCRTVPPRIWRPLSKGLKIEPLSGLDGFPELWDCQQIPKPDKN